MEYTMKKFKFKKAIFLSSFMILFSLFAINIAGAQDIWFEIVPDKTSNNVWETVNKVGVWWKVWDNYKDTAYGEKVSDWSNTREWSDMSLWDQLASWIMTWDTILDYAVYLVKFIWQLALLAGALGIIYFGYSKATDSVSWKSTTISKLSHVVAGILVISFAYVIIKMVWSMFVS